MLKPFGNVGIPWAFALCRIQKIFGDFLQAWIGWVVVTCTLLIAIIVEVNAGFFVHRISKFNAINTVITKNLLFLIGII